jgi:hypothetical protein
MVSFFPFGDPGRWQLSANTAVSIVAVRIILRIIINSIGLFD